MSLMSLTAVELGKEIKGKKSNGQGSRDGSTGSDREPGRNI